ncbi:MAG: hypothetical protein WD928_04045 [Gammaproteobacteria bacterium]
MTTAQWPLLAVLLLSLAAIAPSGAQDAAAPPPAAPAANTTPAAPSDPHRISLESLRALIELRSSKRAELKALREAVAEPEDDLDEAQINAKAAEVRQEILDLNVQIGELATGVDGEEFDLDARIELDLKAEAQQLVEPFVMMLRSLTEQARQIESLRRELSVARNHRNITERALAQLEPLLAKNTDELLGQELARLQALWQERLKTVDDLITATERQLATRQTSSSSAVESANEFARTFIRDRGLNLLYGGAAFFGTLLSLRFVSRRLGAYRHARRARKNFATRVITLIYTVGSFILALLAMLITFNLLNDWLLVGITVVFIFALVWIGIRMLPSLIEQVTLYLNLGAVQEGERIFLDGIPWLVHKLDFYCDLVNPELEGGHFSVPIRQMIGLHSRPVAEREPWFPTHKGDFVRLEQGLAEVLVQTPGLVEVRIEGGIHMTFTAATFYEMAPQNLSRGSRAEVIFGISYKHQAIATGEVREKLRAFVHEGLKQVLREDQIIRVDVELCRAADSAIEYGVEVDMTGDAAVHYDTAEWLLTRLCVDACNHFGWEIPFPQLVVHRPPRSA